MKKIFVTVAEFLENGGMLEKGRTVYDEQDEDANGVYECDHGSNEIVCYFGQVADIIQNDCAYVQIDCTPHYV